MQGKDYNSFLAQYKLIHTEIFLWFVIFWKYPITFNRQLILKDSKYCENILSCVEISWSHVSSTFLFWLQLIAIHPTVVLGHVNHPFCYLISANGGILKQINYYGFEIISALIQFPIIYAFYGLNLGLSLPSGPQSCNPEWSERRCVSLCAIEKPPDPSSCVSTIITCRCRGGTASAVHSSPLVETTL